MLLHIMRQLCILIKSLRNFNKELYKDRHLNCIKFLIVHVANFALVRIYCILEFYYLKALNCSRYNSKCYTQNFCTYENLLNIKWEFAQTNKTLGQVFPFRSFTPILFVYVLFYIFKKKKVLHGSFKKTFTLCIRNKRIT